MLLNALLPSLSPPSNQQDFFKAVFQVSHLSSVSWIQLKSFNMDAVRNLVFKLLHKTFLKSLFFLQLNFGSKSIFLNCSLYVATLLCLSF